MAAMMIPIVSVRLHHIRDPSDVPQLNEPEYRLSGPGSASSSMKDDLAVETIPSDTRASLPQADQSQRVGEEPPSFTAG